MNLEDLLKALNHPRPDVRISTARLLGVLEETRALGAVGQRYRAETDPAVREALAWAGQRLHAAHQAGYSTLNEIFRHFGIDREIANREDPAEAELMKKMQDSLDMELMKMRGDAATKKAGLTTAVAIGGALAGLPVGGMINAAMQPGAEWAESNMGVNRPQIGVQRVPAAAPSTADITVWVRRLRESPDPAQRARAAGELATLNNPAALPILAAAFVADRAPQVQQAAQRAAKLIYWNALYWQMEHDGSLAQEIARRAGALGKAPTSPDAAQPGATPVQPTPPAPPPQQDINAILRQAEAARARRAKR